MATVFSNYDFDYRSIDMNLLIANQTDFEFFNNVFETYNGRTYEDVAVFEYYDNGYRYAFFGGNGVVFNSSLTDVTAGTATGFLEQIWDGSMWIPLWGVENFSYSASALADAIQSSNTTDDFAVIEAILSGKDTINMSSYNDVVRGYAGNDTMAGGAGNDKLYGDAGTDTLKGGPGRDLLNGGTGKDTFVFNTNLSNTNIDTIQSFSHSDDTIHLDDDIFKKLNTGVQHSLTSAQYKENNTGAATDASDRIIYNKSTGDLYYDPDGNGPNAAIKFAVISGGPDDLDYTDFVIVT